MEQAANSVSALIENWQNIRELVSMSIGTNKGTWFADPAFGSELWLLQKEGKVDGETAGRLERMVKESLRWLIDDGLAAAVDCVAERNGKNRINYEITVTRKTGTSVIIKEVWGVV